MQVYQGLDVGSAKPSSSDRKVPNYSILVHALHFPLLRFSLSGQYIEGEDDDFQVLTYFAVNVMCIIRSMKMF